MKLMTTLSASIRSSPARIPSPIQFKKIPRKTNLGWEAMGIRADTEQQKRSPDALVGTERMLGCGGIRRGAYGLVESHYARGACHISSRKKFVQRIQLHHKMKLRQV